MSQTNDLRGKILLNNFTSKTTLKHFRKVKKDDFEVLKKYGLKVFLLRWVKRGKRISLLPNFIEALANNIYLFLPLPLRNYLIGKKVEKSRGEFQKIKIIDSAEIKKIDEILSIVINTKNSPDYFYDILNRYKNQVGFKDIEVIIVDSGSTDDTLKVARVFDSKVIQIKPEDFKHGASRNIGVEAATGKYIVNAVSDAIPSTLDLAFKVATELEEKGAAAVSVRQIPKFDADLFAIWSFWQHYKYIFGELNNDVWVEDVKGFSSMSSHERRKLCIIDDVFVMHNANYIKKEKYDNNIKYAEDILLSISYIKKGFKIGILQSEAVIHSHSRPPEYFFKRYFVDANVIYKIFGTLPNNIFPENIFNKNPKAILSSLIKITEQRLNRFELKDTSWLEKYLSLVGSDTSEVESLKPCWDNLFDNVYKKFDDFIKSTGNQGRKHLDVKQRIATMVSGTLLSEFLLKLPKAKQSDRFETFIDFMEKGI